MEEQESIDIPGEFYSLETGTFFDKCIDCNKFLLEDDTEYFIEKAIKRYEGFTAKDVVFEYAICANCAEKMRNEMSEESMLSMQTYFAENVDFIKRMEIMQANLDNPVAWMENCLVKNTPATQVHEYQIYAHCNGTKLNITQMPYMVSAAALEEITHILSKETLDELGGFMNKHFGPPPELMEGLPSRRLILI